MAELWETHVKYMAQLWLLPTPNTGSDYWYDLVLKPRFADWLGRVQRPVSTLAAKWGAHVKDMEKGCLASPGAKHRRWLVIWNSQTCQVPFRIMSDWLGRVYHPLSMLTAIWDVHVKDIRWAICCCSSWSPTQEVTSDMKFTDHKGHFKIHFE